MNKLLILLLFSPFCGWGQQAQKFNLKQLLNEHKLSYISEEVITGIDRGGELDKNGITVDCPRFPGDEVAIPWLKEARFSTGMIDVDLRGRDSLQLSFIGIVFHGRDTGHYEAVFFRPFRFRARDSSRFHAVQYVSYPEYRWQRLRKEHPLLYESAANPAPGGNDWFHIRIVVSDKSVSVFVNQSSEASLKVRRLGNRNMGKIGLYNVGYPGDFANLTITR
jgi:hypothetical protein